MCDACLPHPCPCTTSPNREAAMVTVKPGVWCDPCIASLVAALNAWGIETIASCCGHGGQDGRISLTDGRELVIRDAAREGSKSVVFGRTSTAPSGSSIASGDES